MLLYQLTHIVLHTFQVRQERLVKSLLRYRIQTLVLVQQRLRGCLVNTVAVPQR